MNFPAAGHPSRYASAALHSGGLVNRAVTVRICNCTEVPSISTAALGSLGGNPARHDRLPFQGKKTQPNPALARGVVVGVKMWVDVDFYVQPRVLTDIGQLDGPAPIDCPEATTRCNLVEGRAPVDAHTDGDRQTVKIDRQGEPLDRGRGIVRDTDDGMLVAPNLPVNPRFIRRKALDLQLRWKFGNEYEMIRFTPIEPPDAVVPP